MTRLKTAARETRTAADNFSQSRFQTPNFYDIYIYIYIS